MRFLMQQDGVGGRFLFTLQNPNEELLLNGLGTENRELCIEAIRSVIQSIPNKNAYQIQNDNNEITVALTSETDVTLGTSPVFATQALAQTWIDALVEDASDELNYQVVSSTVSATSTSKAIKLPSLKNIDFEAMYDFTYIYDGANERLAAYQHSGNSAFYFNVYDEQGKAMLFSRGFDTAGRRNKRIRQVIDAVAKDSRFEIKQENGSYLFIIKERNGLEIARSCQFASETKTIQSISYIQNILPGYDETYPKAEKTKRKMVNQYDTTLVGTGKDGFETMKIEDKGFYFIYNHGGKPVLFGQSYTSGAGRDNGIRSVIKNAGEETRYETRQDNGKYYFVLKSSNRQEIAQSAYFATEGEMKSAMGSVMASTSYASAWDVELSAATTETTETFTLEAPVVAEAAAVEVAVEAAPVAAALATTTDGDGDTGRIADDYLNCREYADHGDADVNDFTRWQHANGEFYFTWHNADGSVKMRSEGYPTSSARDNGMDSVMRNRDNAARYSITEKMGAFFVVLKAGNHQEIARSCGSADKAALLAMFPAMSATEAVVTADEAPAVEVPTEAMAMAAAVVAPTVVVADKEDDYMICEEYKGHEGVDENGITRFKGDDGQFYFTIYDADGKVQLRSEGFRTEADLEVEYDMVVKYRNDSERYTTLEKNGYRMLVLKTPEGREIGRSCLEKIVVAAPVVVEAAAPVAVETIAAVAAVAAAPVAIIVEAPATIVNVEKDREDDYMVCEEYRGHAGKDANGITRFKGKDGQFYFTIYDANGKVELRSEGFKTQADLQVEYDMVVKYRNDDSCYSVIEKNGYSMKVLKTPEGREIGRSCLEKVVVAAPVVVEAAAPVAAPIIAAAAVAAVAAVPAAVVVEAPAPVVVIEKDREDDYMVCEEYRGHAGKDSNGITRFKGKDGQFYFTIYDANGKVELRSEGFKTQADLQVEYDMVVKYRNDDSCYSVIEKNGYSMKVLKTPEGREIGRSCVEKIVVAAPVVVEAPKVAIAAAVVAAAATVAHVIPEPKVEVEAPPAPKIELKKAEVVVEAPKPPVVPVVAAVAASVAAAAVVNNVIKDKEDEYMVCEEYKGHSGKDANGITKFKGADGQFYFTIYDNNGKVQLRSEGFRTEADLKVEYDMVVKYRNDKNRYTVVEKNGYTMRILKTPEGREIGRSCLEKIVVAAAVPPVVAPVAAEVAAGGFKWWYLLPLLLLPLLWFLCNKPAAKLPAVTAPVVVAPTPAVVPAPAKPAAVESCDLNWIFFDFDKSDLRAASKTELDQLAVILKDHKDYVGLISAHTDSKGSDVYNVALSERRAKAARAYMATKGIEGSRIKSEMSGEKDSFTDNDEADVKRQYNRRVELRVMDAKGKEVCKSIAPDVK